MPFLGSIAADDKVPHVLGKFKTGTARPLIEYHQALLRGESPFKVRERELMAAYVSGLNACQYCHGAHSAVAKLLGVPETTVSTLLDDISTADVDDRLRPVFAYIRKLTLTPSRMMQSDADAVYAAG